MVQVVQDQLVGWQVVRPATWTKNEAGIPTQYPCYGFFGMSSEIADIDELQAYAVKLCTSQPYKIGKGQNPSGLLAICRSPKCMRALSGGNDQIQRLCNLQRIAKGKDGATAMNSSAASICYVASTHSVFQGLITRTPPAVRTSTVIAPSECSLQLGFWQLIPNSFCGSSYMCLHVHHDR